MYSHFNSKRFDEKNQVEAGEGNCMHIQTKFYKARGIRAWERARYENDLRRLRHEESLNNKKLLERLKSATTKKEKETFINEEEANNEHDFVEFWKSTSNDNDLICQGMYELHKELDLKTIECGDDW